MVCISIDLLLIRLAGNSRPTRNIHKLTQLSGLLRQRLLLSEFPQIGSYSGFDSEQAQRQPVALYQVTLCFSCADENSLAGNLLIIVLFSSSEHSCMNVISLAEVCMRPTMAY